MMIDASVALTVGVPTVAVLIGILVNNSRLTDLRAYMDARFGAFDKRFDDLRAVVQADLHRVEGIMDARLSRIESELKIR